MSARRAVIAGIAIAILAGCSAPAGEPTPTLLADGATDAPTVAPPASVSPEPSMSPADGDDPYCALVTRAIGDYNDALSLYVDEALGAIATAATTGAMTGINDLGITLNDTGIAARDDMEQAAGYVDDNAEARASILAMVAYIDEYLTPVALVMVAASDFESFNADLTELTQSKLALIEAETEHAATVEAYSEARCGVEIDVMTAP